MQMPWDRDLPPWRIGGTGRLSLPVPPMCRLLQVKPVQVHYLRPRGREVAHEFLLAAS
jgi:hypothetical protein